MNIKLIFRINYMHTLFVLFCLPIIHCLNYCSSNVCKNSKHHTQCKYPSPMPAVGCINHERTIKTIDEKKALLDKINSRRNKIASGDVRSLPSAESMIKLEWNEELEKSAQRWADQCTKQNATEDLRDICLDLRDDIQVGQNIATVYGDAPGLSPLSLVDVWYTELLNINASIILRYATSYDKGFSHYDYFTQLVWARSTEVGCGGVKFKERFNDGNFSKNRTVNRLVCNFAPSGNILGEAVYKAGPPCSRCPLSSNCSSNYKALCSLSHMTTKIKKGSNSIEVVTAKLKQVVKAIDVEGVSEAAEFTDTTENTVTATEEESTNFDLISQLFYFTKQPITILTTQSSKRCKDVLAVDEFVELLKKKLSNDPLFKEFLQSTKGLQNGNDYNLSDPNVAMFVSKIYSKKEPSTTTILPESDYVNSTLLVDLVEAVIFRSGERTISTDEPEEIKQSIIDVSPVRIQAELAKTNKNHDFTGHYFFPEDSNDETNTETYAYEDTASIPVSDIVLEIESIQRDRTTKDFLEDIIESDIVTETLLRRRKRNNVVPFKNDLDYFNEINHSSGTFQMRALPCSKFNNNFDDVLTKYCYLLKTLAMDLKVLKLNERFHCSNSSSIILFNNFMIIFIIICQFIFV